MSDLALLRAQAETAYRGGNYRQAADLYRRARLIAEGREDHQYRLYALQREGDCLAVVGDSDAALATLLEGCTADLRVADPAEVFNCWITAVDISVETKPYGFVRQHLDELRRFVDRHGLTRALPRVYFAEGYLEYARGNYIEARDLYVHSLDIHRKVHPYLTRATHLFALCNCLFRLRDEGGLVRWVKVFEETDRELEQDRVKVLLARLLLCRARGLKGVERTAAIDAARAAQFRIEGLGRNSKHFYVALIRALNLLDNGAEVERLVNRLAPDCFSTKLLKADLFLARARMMLDLPRVDDDWVHEVSDPEPIARRCKDSVEYLNAASTLYREAMSTLKEGREAPVGTDWCRRRAMGRLSRVEAIHRALKAC